VTERLNARLEELLHEKGDSAELVIDGQLRQDSQAKINLADLLDVAAREFDPKTQTIDEVSFESDWSALRVSLQSAAANWSGELRCVSPLSKGESFL
jgi:hypothetical protein